jgi:hypothetical protein
VRRRVRKLVKRRQIPVRRLVQEAEEAQKQERDDLLLVPRPFKQRPKARCWFHVRVGEWVRKLYSSYEEVYDLALELYHQDPDNQSLHSYAAPIIIIPVESKSKYLPN